MSIHEGGDIRFLNGSTYKQYKIHDPPSDLWFGCVCTESDCVYHIVYVSIGNMRGECESKSNGSD